MKRRIVALCIMACMLMSMLCVGCSSNQTPNSDQTPSSNQTPSNNQTPSSNQPVSEPSANSGEKRTFVIYNAAGAAGYHEQVVLAKFQEEFGDKYNIQYETIGTADIVSKIEAQGLQKGNGNVNIVMCGDDLTLGLEAGVWADLSGEESALNISELSEMGKQVWEAYDKSALPITIEPSQPAIAYMPSTEMGQIIDAVVGEDGTITYKEIVQLLADNPDMKMGCGRFPTSGPMTVFTYGLFSQYDTYNANEVPQNSIDMFKAAFTNGQVLLYQGTSDSFKDMTAGNTSFVPHTLSWFYRLYSLKLEEASLPDELKVDSLGLEGAKFAYVVDEAGAAVPAILTDHCYLIPANLSDEDYAASMEFLQWVIQPEMQANILTVLAAPSYNYATADLITDENVKLVWNAVQKYYPDMFLDGKPGEKSIKTSNRDYLLPVTDVGTVNTVRSAWQDQLESLVG